MSHKAPGLEGAAHDDVRSDRVLFLVPVPSAGETERDSAGLLPRRCSRRHVSAWREDKPASEAKRVSSGKGPPPLRTRALPDEEEGPKAPRNKARWLPSTWPGWCVPHAPHLRACWQGLVPPPARLPDSPSEATRFLFPLLLPCWSPFLAKLSLTKGPGSFQKKIDSWLFRDHPPCLAISLAQLTWVQA